MVAQPGTYFALKQSAASLAMTGHLIADVASVVAGDLRQELNSL